MAFSKLLLLAPLAAHVAAAPSAADLTRAQRTVPRDHLRGSDHASTREMLNKALRIGVAAMPRAAPCDAFSLEQLADIEVALFEARSPEQLRSRPDLRTPRHARLETLRREIAEEAAYASKYPESFAALRDGKCADITMQWVHHLSEAARTAFDVAPLPLLPSRGTAEHTLELAEGGHHGVAQKLATKLTCESGHDAKAVERGIWEGFPAWPYEVTYNATGYGPYPFWTPQAKGPGSITVGSPIRTWWSSVLNAERLDHNGKCSLTGLGFAKDGPCTHLFLGNKYAYLFDKKQSFCCISSTPDYKCHMTTPSRDFYKAFDYNGVVQGYESESGYYSGPVKLYSMTMTQNHNFKFWYTTDMDDKPIEQGEGSCAMWDSKGTRNCKTPPKLLWHQYEPSSFQEATLDSEVFALPDVCKTTTAYCRVGEGRGGLPVCGEPSEEVAV